MRNRATIYCVPGLMQKSVFAVTRNAFIENVNNLFKLGRHAGVVAIYAKPRNACEYY